MNQETLAALAAFSPPFVSFAKYGATTIEALNKMCNPLAGITPETARVLAGTTITPEMARVAAALSAKTEQYAKFAKLMDSILPLPPRR